MSWRNGRELATATNGTHTLSCDYDVNGLRTQKTVNGITHTYTYASGKLLRDAWTEGGVTRKPDFFYDPNGHAYVIFYQKGNSRARFYCLTNLQGDVIGLLNTSSQLVAEYSYDAYGNLLTKTNYGASGLASEICDLNPLLYRGYYYDRETGFYYLQSRYYDPALSRFINADSYASTGQGFLGYNMFAYCGNNASTLLDPTGRYAVYEYDEYKDIESNNNHKGSVQINARDVSDEIDNKLFSECLSVAFTKELVGDVIWSFEKYNCFYKRVTHKAPWDIKRESVWRETIGTPFPGVDELVLYHDEAMTPEQLGNYTYGFLGRIYGFPLDVLLAGSWVAAGCPKSGPALENEWTDQHYIVLGFCMDIEEIYQGR